MPSFIDRISTRLAREEWNLGVIHQSIEDIACNGIQQPVRWFPPDPWRIFADPFCVMNQDGSITILAEMLSHWKGRGEIWAATIPKGADPLTARFKPQFVAPAHLSYPFVVQEDGQSYLVMESFEAGGLFLWRKTDTGWHLEKTILNRPAVDATLYRDDQFWWLFCTFQDDQPNDRLHLFHSPTLHGEWTPHPMNPVKIDRSSARPAGALFVVDGDLIRPAQDCSQTYGGSLMLNRVVSLTPDNFEEVPYRQIRPVAGYYSDGIHTVAAAGEYTIVDGKKWHRGLAGNGASRAISTIQKIRRRRVAGSFIPNP
jgi:hypothetical protein